MSKEKKLFRGDEIIKVGSFKGQSIRLTIVNEGGGKYFQKIPKLVFGEHKPSHTDRKKWGKKRR